MTSAKRERREEGGRKKEKLSVQAGDILSKTEIPDREKEYEYELVLVWWENDELTGERT